MIDLSFLTEEEQEAIMKVLSRDAELKRAEDERVRHLEDTVEDDTVLKNMSGQWFYEAKSKRHRDTIHGADIIRASIRKKPQTIAEMIQSKSDKAKKSWVNNVNRDVFVPPELFGVMEEPEKEEEEDERQAQSYHRENFTAKGKPQETLNKVSSPTKKRKNPFNDSTLLEENFASKTEKKVSENGTVHLYDTPEKNTLSSSLESIPSKNVQNNESKKSKNSRDVAMGPQRSTAKPPVPKARTFTYKIMDGQVDGDSTFPKSTKRSELNNGIGARKGILKRSSSSSSTDSEILRIGQNFDSQNKNPLPTSPILEGVVENNSAVEQAEESSQNGLDKLKHVRFSSNVNQKGLQQAPELRKGKELGEYDLLESDLTKNGLHGLNGVKKEPRVSKNSSVSQSSTTESQTTANMPEDGLGLPKHTLPSLSQSSTVESAVNVSDDESGLSKQSLERDPKSITDIPQDCKFSKYSEWDSSPMVAQPVIDVSQQKQTPSSSYNTREPHLSIDELLHQERSPPAAVANQPTNFNAISANVNKNKVSAEILPTREPAHSLNPETQTTKFSVDEQPIYAEIKKSPRVSKPNSADLQQGKPALVEDHRQDDFPKSNKSGYEDNANSPRKTEAEDKHIQSKTLDQKFDTMNADHKEPPLFGKIEDQQPIYASIKKSPQVPKSSSTDLQKGKPILTGDYSHDATSKPDKYAIEFMKATDESISKVLDWFNRSSETGDGTMLQPSKTTEETYSPLKTETNNTSTENTRAAAGDVRFQSSKQERVKSNGTEKDNQLHFSENKHWKGDLLLFGNSKNGAGKSRNTDSVNLFTETEDENLQPPYLDQKWENQHTVQGGGDETYYDTTNYSDSKLQEQTNLNIQADLNSLKSKSKRGTMNVHTSKEFLEEPKLESTAKIINGKMSEDKTGLDVRTGPKETVDKQPEFLDRENMQTVRPLILEQSECMQPLKTLEPFQQKRRVSDMKSFWEGDKAAVSVSRDSNNKPNQESSRDDIVNTNAEYSPTDPKDPNKYNLVDIKNIECLDEEQLPPSVTSLKSFWEKEKKEPKTIQNKPRLDDTTDKPGKTMDFTKRNSEEFTGSPTTEDSQLKRAHNVTEMSKHFENRNESPTPLKIDKTHANFNIVSLKERLNDDSKDQVSNPSQFQSLRSFWNVGNKSLDKTDLKPSVPHRPTTSKSINTSIPSDIQTNKDLMEAKEKMPENVQAKVEAQDQNQMLNIQKSHPREEKYQRSSRNTEQLDPIALVESKKREDLSKETQDTLYQPISGKGKSKEKDSRQQWHTSENKMHQNQIPPTDIHKELELLRKEVAETVKKATASSKDDNLFNVALEKLKREAAESSSDSNQNILSEEPSQTNQRRFFEKVLERSHNDSADFQKEREVCPSEVRKTVLKANVPLKTDLTKFNSSLEKLPNEAPKTLPPLYVAAVGDDKIQENVSGSKQECSFKKEMQSSHTCSTDPMQKVAKGSTKQILEKVEKTMAAPKTEHSAVSIGIDNAPREISKPSPPPHQNIARNQISCDAPSQPQERGASEKIIQLKDYQKERDYSEEIKEIIEKTTSSQKIDLSSFDINLAKLQREAAELSSEKYSPPYQGQYSEKAMPFDSDYSINCQKENGAFPQEVKESIEKTVAPSKTSIDEFTVSLEKLYKEVARAPSLHLTTTEDHNVQKNVSGGKRDSSDDEMMHASQRMATDIPKKIEYPTEVNETMTKTAAPEKAERSIFNTGLENLHKETLEMSPKLVNTSANREDMFVNMPGYGEQKCNKNEMPFRRSVPSTFQETRSNENSRKMSPPEETSITVKRMEFDQQDSPSYQEKEYLPQEVKERIENNITSRNAEISAFKANLEKLQQEAVEAESQSYLRNDGAFLPDHNSESQQTAHNTMPTNLNSTSQAHLQMMVPVMKENMKQNNEKHEEHFALGAFVANDITVPKVPERNVATLNTSINSNVESDGTSLAPGAKNEVMSKAIKEEKRIERDNVDDSTHGDEQVTGSDVCKHITEANVSSSYVTKSTPLKDVASSNRRSTVELYLTSPYQEDEDLAHYDDSSLSDGNADSYASTWCTSSRSEDELNPLMMALKRSAAKSMPSKSLEDIPSVTSNERKVDIPKEVLSDEDDQKTDQSRDTHEGVPGISTVSSFPKSQFSNPEKLKRLSQSVPAFLQDESDERETDSASESSFQLGRHRKSPSSLTNLSGSSGMASMSSVSGSVMSIYSGDFGNVDVKGNIQFAIDYVEQLREFHIFVAQCKDLAVADVKKQRSDPYVKSYLLPDKAKMGKRKSAVRKKTLNPAYNEILRYKIDRKTLLAQKLNLSVWHNDTFGRNSFLGEVELDLATWDWNNKQMNWFPLKPRTPAASLAAENRGEIKLALRYVPQPPTGIKPLETGEVHIWVKECKDLPLLRGNRINSFVKCTILPDTSRKSRQKTRSVEKTTNPSFNHTMVYDGFRSEDLKEACIELTVWDHNRLANHFLGGLRIGLGTGKSYGTSVDWMDSTTDEVSFWERMIRSPNVWVEDTLPLRMLMVAKMTK